MLLKNVDPEKWYTVTEVSRILGWGVDAVRDWIYGGHLQAFVKPGTSDRRKRIYRGVRVKGSEIIRFANAHLTVLNPERKLRLRAA
jgi:hypothetical protein